MTASRRSLFLTATLLGVGLIAGVAALPSAPLSAQSILRRPVFHYNLCGVERYSVAGQQPLKAMERWSPAQFRIQASPPVFLLKSGR
jgi:hypothetical protein